MEEHRHRIPHALHLHDWVYGRDKEDFLRDNAVPIGPSEYQPEMAGKIFCPSCTTPLSRTPKVADLFANSRTAHFKHQAAFKDVPCNLRTKRGQGLSYSSEEELKRAVQNDELVIVGGWQSSPPEQPIDEADVDVVFNMTQIEDPEGPPTQVPLGRHTGARFSLPSKLSTVLAICRNFDKNLARAFFFPDSQYSMLLVDKLYDINLLDDGPPSQSHLFYGRIRSVSRLTKRDKLTLESDEGIELKVYTWPTHNDRKKLSKSSIGRILLFYGSLYKESDGILACKINDWGAYSLLPEKYESLLPD
ncbi:hypothetical protein [Burkholderia cenocepacia]|uniref:hypothetical protein n=1 Tax=Burkholderia cenocepacia TaxID=95486 RepID=UPI00196A30BC|nr:hypothetical protein [Burkholderia cenocepacia]MBN3503699.1 hypothetical protein [Burkholderia cenocepacia]MBR8406908.1 hypothetical protein [Burkholderia cenocepacia]MCO1398418.1 hypothetical protein [Burkholderia cenocepacia]MCO1410990.1 hypothetical protein [Burkholderia cenocepacia]MDN7645818.1 hypothetical protein [Burkholderia cenocepacia]